MYEIINELILKFFVLCMKAIIVMKKAIKKYQGMDNAKSHEKKNYEQ
jgi:hypothetical protein